MVSEYATIHMNMSNCARILNIPESAEIYRNLGKYTLICLFTNMAEYAWNITCLNKPGI